MNAPTLTAPARNATGSGVPQRNEGSRTLGDLSLYALLVLLVVAAWQVSRYERLRPSDDLSYWIGVAGGSMMLALFAYPLRKRMRALQRLGKVKTWFWLHLVLGIAGPWLILLHSSFRIGSLNAGVALVSMCIVVASGVIGRFIYVRVHRGLDGQRSSLEELRARAGLVENETRSRLHFAPRVEAALLAFEQRELKARPGWRTTLRQVTALPLQQLAAEWRCRAELTRRLRLLARECAWSEADLARRTRHARKLVRRYLDAVVRVAQYTAFERAFALWHVAHLPFVYLFVISALVHVVAVHAY